MIKLQSIIINLPHKFKFNRHLQLLCYKVNLRMDQLMTLHRLILLIFSEEFMNLHLINKDLGFKLFMFKVMMIILKKALNLFTKMEIMINITIIKKIKLNLIFNNGIEIFQLRSLKKIYKATKKSNSREINLNICLHSLEIKDIIFLDK